MEDDTLMLVIDVETTIANKGSPFNPNNHMVMVGCLSQNGTITTEGTKAGYADMVSVTQSIVDSHNLLVGFNIKFDLHWLAQYGIKFQSKQIWDCQLAHFMITYQLEKRISLNFVAEYYGLGQKLDVVKTEYWDKGIDTDAIPKDILSKYLIQDLELTKQVYEKQMAYLEDKPQLKKLIQISCLDTLVLQEMEFNGLKYNHAQGQQLVDEMQLEVQQIEKELCELFSINVPMNWASDDQLRAVLYGGKIKQVVREEYLFKYVDGRTKPKMKDVTKEHLFPKIVEPLKHAKTEKGKFQVGGPIISQLKFPRTHSKAKGLLMRMIELEKESSTLVGLTKLAKEQCWGEDILHGRLQQTTAVTGRLASKKPNLQNLSSKADPLIYSRYS